MPEEFSTWVPVATGGGGPSAHDTEEQAAVPARSPLGVGGAGLGVPVAVAGAVGVVTVPDDGAPYRFDDTAPLPAASGGAALGTLEEDAPWPSHAVRRGIRMRVPTAVLLGLLLAGGAFWGGAAVEKSRSSSTGTGGAVASRFRSLFASAGAGGRSTSGASGARSGGASAFAGLGGTSSAAATGQVTFVKGDTLYVTTSSGDIVTVDVTPSTKVTRDATASVSALKPGDTVVVQGSTAKDGTVTASSLSATQQGVSSGGGFGGFGGSSGRGAAG